MSKKRKHYNPKKHLADKVVGLVVSWRDDKPEVENNLLAYGKVTHRKAYLRFTAPLYFSTNVRWIVYEATLLWSVEITVIFNYPNGQQQREVRLVTAYITLSELDDLTMDEIEDAKRHGGIECYSHTEFMIECIGLLPPDEDEELKKTLETLYTDTNTTA